MRLVLNSSGPASILLTFTLLLAACHENGPGGPGPDPPTDPPFGGTIFVDPDIIMETDSSTYLGIGDAGQDTRTMFDRRVNDWISLEAFLFNADYGQEKQVEIQVNPEIPLDDARFFADYYAEVIGRLPGVLMQDLQTVWIHRGDQPFGGGNNNLLIHLGRADQFEKDGILEEVFVHEAAHTSLDADHVNSAGWLKAQQDDPAFISDYAKEFPQREDIAESFLLYLAIRYREDRIAPFTASTIESTIPNRIAYFDAQQFDMFPVE